MKFTNEITNEKEAKQFLKDLQIDYPMLHLEFDFKDYFNSKTDERTFTDEEAELLDLRTDEVYDLIDDPMAYVCKINNIKL